MSNRSWLIAVIVVVALFGGWKLWSGHVNRGDANDVGRAFLSALKDNKLDLAGDFWVPDGADAWRVSAKEKLDRMQTGTHTRFFEDLPAKPVFVSSRTAGGPENEQTLTSGGTSLGLRQIDGKWYVFAAPL